MWWNMKYKLNQKEISKLLSDYEYMGYDEEYAKDELVDPPETRALSSLDS